jgi:hypothetical protein
MVRMGNWEWLNMVQMQIDKTKIKPTKWPVFVLLVISRLKNTKGVNLDLDWTCFDG